MTITLSNVGHSTKDEMLNDVAEASFRQTTFVVVATFLAHKYPDRFPPIELLKHAAREGMGWNTSQYVPPDIVITEDGDSHRASGEIYCPVISVPLILEAKLAYNDAPDNDPDDRDHQAIDEVSFVSVTVRYGNRSMVIEAELLQQSVNALCSAEAFPVDMMSRVAALWQR